MPAPLHSFGTALQGFLDAVTRHTVRGWARDPVQPGLRLVMEAVADGRVLGQAVADMFRGDVAAAGLGDGHCGFSIDLGIHANDLADASVTVRVSNGGSELQGSPATAADPPSLARFLHRWHELSPAVLARLRRMMRHRTTGGVSVIATGNADLPALIDSLRAQFCDRWELIPAVPGLPTATIDDALAKARYRLALIVTGPVRMEADAVYHMLRAAAASRSELFLWDQAVTQADRPVVDLLCRPAFSLDQYLSNPELGGAFAVGCGRRRLRDIGWVDQVAHERAASSGGRAVGVGK